MKRKKMKMAILFFSFLVLSSFLLFAQTEKKSKSWDDVKAIMKRIKTPKFPNRIFDITKFGAVPDGKTESTEAINKAITECSAKGGGKVIIPKGAFYTAAIHLKSNVNLYISKGAILKFSVEPVKYQPMVFTRWEGVECINYSALIYAFEQENIGVSGEGILDGQASDSNWWAWKGNKKGADDGKPDQTKDVEKLYEMGQKGTPVKDRIFGFGHYLRPNFIQFYKCKNIIIDGVNIKNSPMWVIHPVLCSNVTVSKVSIEGLGPNTDGCNPESCEDVLIKDCYFNNGDDCIAIKSGRNNDGRRVNVPSKNIIIRNCHMKEGHGGVVIGSEIAGGVMNVFTEDCVMDSPNLDRALRFKTNSLRGGLVENIFFRNIKIGQVGGEVLRIDFYYGEGDVGEFTPIIRNIFIDNVTCKKSKYGIWIKAYERSPVYGVNLTNCKFDGVESGNILEGIKEINYNNVEINGKIINNK